MDENRKNLELNFTRLAKGAVNGKLKSFLGFAVTEEGPTSFALIQPEDRELIIQKINTEMTLMLGEPHHLVSTSKLGRLFATFGISESDLASFHETELALDEPDTNVIPFIPKKSE